MHSTHITQQCNKRRYCEIILVISKHITVVMQHSKWKFIKNNLTGINMVNSSTDCLCSTDYLWVGSLQCLSCFSTSFSFLSEDSNSWPWWDEDMAFSSSHPVLHFNPDVSRFTLSEIKMLCRLAWKLIHPWRSKNIHLA